MTITVMSAITVNLLSRKEHEMLILQLGGQKKCLRAEFLKCKTVLLFLQMKK